jgi:hypothetical protein
VAAPGGVIDIAVTKPSAGAVKITEITYRDARNQLYGKGLGQKLILLLFLFLYVFYLFIYFFQ